MSTLRVRFSEVAVSAKFSFLELLRSKALAVMVVSLLVNTGMGLLSTNLILIDPIRFLMSVSLSLTLVSASVLSSLWNIQGLQREFQSRRSFLVLARSISPYSWIFGRYLGITGFCALKRS